ncbi:MAG: flagellar brake protein [Lachnospiraceae bacterium]|nr:flagellar brake protein [Lachnospiraceae bacterium]
MRTDVLKIGDKVEIRIVMEVAQERKTGVAARVFKSQLLDMKENGDLELAMPFSGNRIVLLPLELRYEFIFSAKESVLYKAEGQITERYKSENRFMIRVRLASELEKIQRRAFFRLECSMDVVFWKITEEQMALPNAEAIVRSLQDGEEFVHSQIKARTIDISGGGARFQTEYALEEGQCLLMCINLQSDERDEQIIVPGRVLTSEEIKTAHHTVYRSRIVFVNSDKKVNEAIVRFVFSEERKYRKSGKGVV